MNEFDNHNHALIPLVGKQTPFGLLAAPQLKSLSTDLSSIMLCQLLSVIMLYELLIHVTKSAYALTLTVLRMRSPL